MKPDLYPGKATYLTRGTMDRKKKSAKLFICGTQSLRLPDLNPHSKSLG